MIEIETLTLGQLDTNCYLVWCTKTKEAIVIDPADEGSLISERILALGLKPLSIVLTHGHFDHVLGCLEVKLNFDLPIFVHKKDLFLTQSAQKNAKYWLNVAVDPVPPINNFIQEGGEIEFGECSLKVLETPGHTPGSLTLYSLDNDPPLAFTGDTLFKNGVGRTDFSYSSPQDLSESLNRLFDLLPDETVCFSGHGEPTVLGKEKG
jgi:hydroxyacylglutathione hydrolase